MRVIVISDSHGDSFSIKEVISKHPDAMILYFLGDGERDIDNAVSPYSKLKVISVKGNCDFYSFLPEIIIDEVNGNRIYCTHGYLEFVKYGTQKLIERAREENASIALYGHTHKAVTKYCDGLWLVNPGSIRNKEYAVIDITDKGIMPILLKL